MKQFSLFLSIFLLSIVSHAQTCSSYGFTATTGTFNTISGTGTSTTAISADDVTLPNVPIGFTFRFCGNNYTNVSVCSNGWLSLANTTTDYGYVNDPTNVASYAFPVTSTGFLMPFWDDLWGTGQTAYYQTSGTAPYRTFTFEWSNWSLYADYVHYANFQVILYETTNQIDYVYGTSSFPTRTATIGIANSPTDYKVLNNSTSSPTASTSTFTTSIATLPANAQIYRWNPAATACSGTPTAGTASSAQTSVCASGTINLSLTGYTLLSGVTYQWQKSTDGTTWTNISGATNVTASTTESVSTYYRCNVTCTASSTTSSSANVLVPYTTSCYCTPAYSRAFASCDSLDVSIDGFKVNGTAGTSINDISHCNGTGYINQTSTNVALLAATTYTATIMGSATYTMNAQVWIDFNNDMTFQSSESVGGLNAYGATGTFSLTIPSGAATGTHRMRVVTADNASGHSYSTMDPCTSGYALGEARDYNVTIYATCSGTPLGGTASTSASPVCSAVSFTLSNSGYTVGGSITYQWQSSPDNTTWTSMTGATTLTYTGTETATTYYRCLVTCTASSTATPSASILVSYLSSCYCTPAYSAASAACTAGTAIANLQIAGLSGTVLNDAIACTGAGFQNRTSLSVTIGQGTTATAYIGGGTTSQNTQAWIDYDNNGTFASAESVGGLNGFTTSGSFTITIPAGAATGVHRMRVVTSAASDGFSYSSMNPCTPSYVNGEARDYSINIVPYCSGTPTAGTVSPSATSSCSTFSPTITASGYSTGNNFYRWESSSDSATWTRVAGATLNVYAPSVTTTTYFRFIDSCGTNTLLGRSAGVKITINTVPTVVVTPVSATYCNGSSTSITASGASTYSWSPATALSASTGATVTCTATITTTYTITGTSAAGCTGTATQTITVNPIPVLTVTPVSASYCTGGSTNITASGASTYSWSPATNLSATTGATVTCNTAATRTYTITGTSAAGCAGTATQTITVNPIPVLTVTPASATYCNGSSTSITASGASTYSWSPATAFSASTGATVTCSATTTTTYTVTGTSAAGCTGTATQTITVNPIPVLTVTPVSASYCTGGSTNITASGASTYSWSPATNLSATTGATVSCNTAATRTYTITGTSAAGCAGTATQTITVNAIPVLTVTPVSATYCNGSSTSITASGASTYSWSPATALSASTGATVTCTATTTTNYTVTGTSGAGCTGTATQTITVNPIPVLTVTPVSASYCTGGSTNITASGASTYSWSPATNLSATTGATVTCNTAATRTYTITGTSAAGCAGTATQTITVNAIPVLTVTPVSATYCNGSSTSITASGASTYSWSPATALSASTGATVTCTATTTTTYTITGTSGAGCAGAATQTITVNPIPVLTVTPVSASYCTGGSTNITASGASTYSWSPATNLSATTGATISCNTAATRTYTITGTSAAGCVGTATQSITVNPIPVLTVTPVSASYCTGGSTNITASGASTYSWSPATNLSATTGATVTCNTAATRTYTITGTSAAGCAGTATQTITVNAIPVLTVTPVSATYCNGSSTSITASGASTYSWSPATALSASTGATVTCSATTTTTYTVTGTSAAGCTGTATQTITVNPIPVLTVTPVSASYCAGGSTNITASGASTYSWSPATNLSATTGATVSCNTAATRTYTITGTSAAGCVGTATQTITVNPIPVLTVTPVSATYCNGSSTSITASGASTYSWSPATALSASTGATVTCTATTTTTYTVTGTSGAGCTGTATQTITVNPIPVLTVTPVSASYCNGSSSSITASGASTYTWSPATNLSATTGATVTCNTAATRTYTITGASAAGCAGTATQTITVNAIPVLTVTPVSASYCTGGSTNITASGASTYSWSPATNLSATTGATVTCNTAATRTYTITGTSAAGCAGTATQTITVNSIPVLTVTPVASTICSGTTTNISASGAATFTWAPSTALSASTGTTVTCSATGTTTYTITGTSGAGCTVTATQTIAVNAAPILTVIPVASSYCAGGSTSITASGAISYSWSPATNLSGTTGSTVTSNTAATRTYTVTGTNGAGCTGTQTTTISVNALPSAATITSAITPCTGHATNIVFSGTAGDTIRYAIDGGVYIPVVLAGGTYTLSTGIITSSHTYLLHNVRNAACFLNIDTTILVHPILLSWIGVADTSWNNTGNWSCGTIPTATDDVYLNPGGTFLPAMPAASNISVRNMSIASGASIRANATATINIKGNLTLHGNINGQGYVKLNGTIAQTISGTGKLENFELNNSAGATITTGSKLTITNTLAVQAGTLATGDSLVLYSDSIATARVLPMPPTGAAISGNVKAMQYIPGGLRRFRFVSHPFSSYIGLNQIQNGIDITGIGGSSNGFTNTASNAPSAFRYNPLVGNDSLGYDPGWRPFTSAYTTADSNRLHQYQGVRLFFRGQKGEGLSYGTYTPSSATIAQTGVLNQGTQYVTLAKGSVSHQDYNMVGNPYASPVDIGTVIHNAKVAGKLAGSAYYVWNPYLGAAGQFQAITINTTTATPYYLQANCAFQVRAAHNGDTLTFTETNKGPAANVALLKANNDFVMLTIYDANYHPWDMLQLQFNADASAKDGDEDATKPSGADFNFYSKSADNHKLAIDSRPYEAGNVIPLGISGNYAQDYIIKTENLAIPTGSNLYLHDKLLQQYVALQTGSEYKFSVTADKATQGEQRFELSMDPQLTTAGNTRKGLQINLTPNPATDNVNIDFSTDNNNIQVRIVDLGGVNVYQTEITGKQSGKVNISKGKFTAGIYMVEITSGDQKVIQRLIKE